MYIYYGTDQTASGGLAVFKALDDDDIVTIARAATIYAPGGRAFDLAAGNRMSIFGQIFANTIGINGNLGDDDADIRIYAGGVVSAGTDAITSSGDDTRVFNAGVVEGRTGITLSGANAQVVNEGTIVAIANAVFLGSSADGGARLVNSGSIDSSDSDAVQISADGLSYVNNSGTISSERPSVTYGGLYMAGGSDQLDLTNSGTISGYGYSIWATNGDDIVRNTGALIGNVLLRGGDDTYDGAGGVVGATVVGDSGDDTLSGGASSDRLDGGGDNDIIEGNAGADRLFGGYGFDVINGGDGADVIDGGADEDEIDGGAGSDTVVFSDAVTLDLADTSLSTGDARGDSYISIETFRGGEFVDILRGSAAGERLFGGASGDTLDGRDGNDTLAGQDGDDLLIGGLGNDRLLGGNGIDTASYAGATIGVAVNLDLGGRQDTVGAGKDLLVDIENLIGSAQGDQLTGDYGANRLDGAVGNDIVNGGEGDDIIVGSAGNDQMTGGAGIDTLDYSATAGAITLDLSLATAQATGGSNSDTVAAIENVIGTVNGDTLTGSSVANVLAGGLGNDTLNGGDGNDRVIGGLGNDVMTGGLGSDTADYSEFLTDVRVKLTLTVQQNTLAGGLDTLSSIENLIGGAGNDQFTGDTQANVIEGGAGDDIINGAAGLDTASYSSASGGVTVDLRIATVQNTFGAGSDTLTLMESLLGSAFNDTLTGTDANNRIDGGAGNDTINGLGGVDTIDAGGGYNTVNAGAGNDIIIGGGGSSAIDGGADFDTVNYSTFDYGIGLYVDLALGTVDDEFFFYVADTLTNVEAVVGTAYSDVFGSGAGAQTVTGGAGNDSFNFSVGTAAGDTIVDFNAAQGDKLYFYAYGAGSTFTKIDATHWQVTNSTTALSETITFTNGATITPATDVIFG